MTFEERTYVVEGMSCDHCKVAIRAEVEQVAGVESVDIDLATKLVRIAGEGVDDAAVMAAFDEAGYDSEPVPAGTEGA
jgi:copper chaperone